MLGIELFHVLCNDQVAICRDRCTGRENIAMVVLGIANAPSRQVDLVVSVVLDLYPVAGIVSGVRIEIDLRNIKVGSPGRTVEARGYGLRTGEVRVGALIVIVTTKRRRGEFIERIARIRNGRHRYIVAAEINAGPGIGGGRDRTDLDPSRAGRIHLQGKRHLRSQSELAFDLVAGVRGAPANERFCFVDIVLPIGIRTSPLLEMLLHIMRHFRLIFLNDIIKAVFQEDRVNQIRIAVDEVILERRVIRNGVEHIRRITEGRGVKRHTQAVFGRRSTT